MKEGNDQEAYIPALFIPNHPQMHHLSPVTSLSVIYPPFPCPPTWPIATTLEVRTATKTGSPSLNKSGG